MNAMHQMLFVRTFVFQTVILTSGQCWYNGTSTIDVVVFVSLCLSRIQIFSAKATNGRRPHAARRQMESAGVGNEQDLSLQSPFVVNRGLVGLPCYIAMLIERFQARKPRSRPTRWLDALLCSISRSSSIYIYV